MVVTGTQTPRLNLDASVAVTTLTAREIEAAAPQAAGFQFKADWHWVGSRFSDPAMFRFVDARLPAYQYFNLGVGLALPNAGARVSLDLLNAFQSKGLEEGNPRLASAGTNVFLARPLLPRRLQAAIEYDFGGGSRR